VTLKICEISGIVVFLAIAARMNRNMESVITILTPVGLLSIVSVLFLSCHQRPQTCSNR